MSFYCVYHLCYCHVRYVIKRNISDRFGEGASNKSICTVISFRERSSKYIFNWYLQHSLIQFFRFDGFTAYDNHLVSILPPVTPVTCLSNVVTQWTLKVTQVTSKCVKEGIQNLCNVFTKKYKYMQNHSRIFENGLFIYRKTNFIRY